MNRDRLRRKHTDLQRQFDLLRDRIERMRATHAITVDPNKRLQLETQIQQAEAESATVEQELIAIEQQLLPDDPSSGFSAPVVSATEVEVEAEKLIQRELGGPPTIPLELPEGTMPPGSPFYIERPGDRTVLMSIRRQGETITIKGPRQVGKSSLLNRAISAARELGKRVVLLDFQQFDAATRADADSFFRQFCQWVTEELVLADQLERFWNQSLAPVLRVTSYFQDYLLPTVDQSLVLALDEVDSILDSPFRTDFFGMLRSWHNSRATSDIWRQLDLLLVTSIDPAYLVPDTDQSPFSVGEVIELHDFSPEQVAELNRRHNAPFTTGEEQQLVALLNGHPYLTRRALYLVADQRFTPADIFVDATAENGPFGEHLRGHLLRLAERAELVEGMRQVLRTRTCDEQSFFRLRGAGLVRRTGQQVLPRCQLYAEYLRERL